MIDFIKISPLSGEIFFCLEVFWRNGAWPFFAAERAVIDAGFVLVASELTIDAERNDM